MGARERNGWKNWRSWAGVEYWRWRFEREREESWQTAGPGPGHRSAEVEDGWSNCIMNGEAAYIKVAHVTQERKVVSSWCKSLVKGEWPGCQESQARGEVEGPQAAGGLCGSRGADSLLTAVGTGRHSFLRGSPPPSGWDSHACAGSTRRRRMALSSGVAVSRPHFSPGAPQGFPGHSVGKESPAMWDPGSIPGLGRSPGEGKGYPVQYSGLENFMDCISHGIAKSRTGLTTFTFTFTFHRAAPQW